MALHDMSLEYKFAKTSAFFPFFCDRTYLSVTAIFSKTCFNVYPSVMLCKIDKKLFSLPLDHKKL